MGSSAVPNPLSCNVVFRGDLVFWVLGLRLAGAPSVFTNPDSEMDFLKSHPAHIGRSDGSSRGSSLSLCVDGLGP